MKRGSVLALAAFFVVILGATSFAWAGEAAEEEEAASSSFLSILASGSGWLFGPPFLLASIISLGLVIEHFITIRREVLIPPELLSRIEQLMEEEEYEEVMSLCEATPGPLTNVLAAGLPKIGTGWDNIEGAMGEVMTVEAAKLNIKISYINLLSNLCPMLGLFGTVTGMMFAFDTMARSKTSPTPAELAYGVQMALVTTFDGLIIAMPLIAFFFFFRNRVTRVLMEINAITGELMEKFKDQQ